MMCPYVFVLQKWSFTRERFWDEIDTCAIIYHENIWSRECVSIIFLTEIRQMTLNLKCKIVFDISRFKALSGIDNVSTFFHSVLRQYHRATMFLIYLIYYVRLQTEYVQPTQHAVTGWRMHDGMSPTT